MVNTNAERQLLIKIPVIEYQMIDEFCTKSGMTKKALIQIAVKNFFAEIGVAIEADSE